MYYILIDVKRTIIIASGELNNLCSTFHVHSETVYERLPSYWFVKNTLMRRMKQN